MGYRIWGGHARSYFRVNQKFPNMTISSANFLQVSPQFPEINVTFTPRTLTDIDNSGRIKWRLCPEYQPHHKLDTVCIFARVSGNRID